MKKFFLLFSFLVLTSCFGGDISFDKNAVKGSGIEKKEKREVASFNAIEIDCYAKANITCQDKQSVEITGDDNIIALLLTEIKDNTLSIKTSKSYNPDKPLQINIAIPNIEKLSLSGAAQTVLSNVKNDKLTIDVSGAGTIKAQGETQLLDITLSGAGALDTKDLQANKVTANVSGAGSVSLFSKEQLDATVSGVGSINYYGNPKVVNKKVTGVGSIKAN
jgi:hypothetical protein